MKAFAQAYLVWLCLFVIGFATGAFIVSQQTSALHP